jgi:hypothetical protein
MINTTITAYRRTAQKFPVGPDHPNRVTRPQLREESEKLPHVLP